MRCTGVLSIAPSSSTASIAARQPPHRRMHALTVLCARAAWGEKRRPGWVQNRRARRAEMRVESLLRTRLVLTTSAAEGENRRSCGRVG